MLEDLIADRKKKLEKLKAAGVDPYPARVTRTQTVAEALAIFSAHPEGGPAVAVAGRVMGLRDQGGLMFLDIDDGTGVIQAVVKKEQYADFELLRDTLDRGDFASIAGTLFLTNRGAKSVEAKEARIIGKSLRPLPSEWYGVEDEELRLRKRYLELLLESKTRDMFRKKGAFWNAAREFLNQAGFLEVEMSALEPLPGGAEAEPFVTHHNALDTDFYLRIALELPLKKLLVGGFEKVFEIGRVFRNEGIDREHLQDYIALEFYWAYADYHMLMEFVERMYKFVIEHACGTLVTSWNGHSIDWGKPWPRLDYGEAFKAATGLDLNTVSRDDLFRKAAELGLGPEDGLGKGRLIDLIYKKTVRPSLIQPTLLINHPVEISPLSKRSPDNPKVVERIQVLACGSELGNGWSELNDPLDQRERFEEQMKLREAGDKEAQFLDEDFVEALEYGMPPAAGFGLSERLFAVLMDKPIRETVFFPLMKRKEKNLESGI